MTLVARLAVTFLDAKQGKSLSSKWLPSGWGGQGIPDECVRLTDIITFSYEATRRVFALEGASPQRMDPGLGQKRSTAFPLDERQARVKSSGWEVG